MKKNKKYLFGNFIFSFYLCSAKTVNPKYQDILRGGAVVARWAHNPKVVGSSPAPATKENAKGIIKSLAFFFSQKSPFIFKQRKKRS